MICSSDPDEPPVGPKHTHTHTHSHTREAARVGSLEKGVGVRGGERLKLHFFWFFQELATKLLKWCGHKFQAVSKSASIIKHQTCPGMGIVARSHSNISVASVFPRIWNPACQGHNIQKSNIKPFPLCAHWGRAAPPTAASGKSAPRILNMRNGKSQILNLLRGF